MLQSVAWREGGQTDGGYCMRLALFLSVLLGGVFFAEPTFKASAQMTRAGCVDLFGQPIVPVVSHRITDVGMARRDRRGGRPLIIYNPRLLARLKPQTRLFFYAHECAHHALGHTIGLGHPLAVEQEADCWAVRNLVRRRILGPRDIAVVQADLAALARGDRTHLPGPERAKRLPGCLMF